MTFYNRTADELKTTCKLIGVKVSGRKDDIACRIVDWLNLAPADVVASRIEMQVPGAAALREALCHSYRDINASDLEVGMPTHNGYCTDSVKYVGTEPERGTKRFQYQGKYNGEVYVRFWFQGNKRCYDASQTVPVNTRWLIENNKLHIAARYVER